jgi:hypothetical protein
MLAQVHKLTLIIPHPQMERRIRCAPFHRYRWKLEQARKRHALTEDTCDKSVVFDWRRLFPSCLVDQDHQ